MKRAIQIHFYFCTYSEHFFDSFLLTLTPFENSNIFIAYYGSFLSVITLFVNIKAAAKLSSLPVILSTDLVLFFAYFGRD